MSGIEATDQDDDSCEYLFASFTSAMGLALGELLLLSGRPEKLGGCLAAIETMTYATLLSSDLRGGGKSLRGRSLVSAALRVVRTWREGGEDLASLGNAIQVLQEVLEVMGVRFVPATCEGSMKE